MRHKQVFQKAAGIVSVCIVWQFVSTVKIKQLLNDGKSIDKISVQLGMRKEEVFRLTDFSKQDFLKLMVTDESFSNAKLIKKI